MPAVSSGRAGRWAGLTGNKWRSRRRRRWGGRLLKSLWKGSQNRTWAGTPPGMWGSARTGSRQHTAGGCWTRGGPGGGATNRVYFVVTRDECGVDLNLYVAYAEGLYSSTSPPAAILNPGGSCP